MLALTMKTVYGCDGVSTRQHNEPAGSQDVWHYHLHVIPRYKDDNYYATQREHMSINERAMHAEKIRKHLTTIQLRD
jgi:histidine triad (HIT) family protein